MRMVVGMGMRLRMAVRMRMGRAVRMGMDVLVLMRVAMDAVSMRHACGDDEYPRPALRPGRNRTCCTSDDLHLFEPHLVAALDQKLDAAAARTRLLRAPRSSPRLRNRGNRRCPRGSRISSVAPSAGPPSAAASTAKRSAWASTCESAPISSTRRVTRRACAAAACSCTRSINAVASETSCMKRDLRVRRRATVGRRARC